MGKVSRWMKGLFGAKKDRETADKKSEKREKARWSVVGSRKESGPLGQIPGDGSDWRRTHITDSEKEQSRHAIAVAAATAAAADAAVAAANAAVEVVRLTSRGRGGMFFAGGRETLAATRIQAVFRGHLARKALRALKGLVKLQAIFRGYLVRKRAAATLHSIQALMRVQTAVQSQRARRSLCNEQQSYPKTRTRKSTDRLEGTKSEFHSKRLSSTYDPSLCAFEEIPKIVEIDTCRPRSGSRRLSNCMSEYCDHQYYRTEASPLPYPTLKRHSIPDSLHSTDLDSRFAEEDYRFATAQNTPRFGCSSWAPTTPAKSVCGDSFFKSYSSNCPSYMANTESFSSKVRSHSAPKQRPGSGIKKRLSLDELMSSRASFGSARMRRPLTRAEEEFES